MLAHTIYWKTNWNEIKEKLLSCELKNQEPSNKQDYTSTDILPAPDRRWVEKGNQTTQIDFSLLVFKPPSWQNIFLSKFTSPTLAKQKRGNDNENLIWNLIPLPSPHSVEPMTHQIGPAIPPPIGSLSPSPHVPHASYLYHHKDNTPKSQSHLICFVTHLPPATKLHLKIPPSTTQLLPLTFSLISLSCYTISSIPLLSCKVPIMIFYVPMIKTSHLKVTLFQVQKLFLHILNITQGSDHDFNNP